MKQVLKLFVVLAVIFFLWPTPAMYPLKLLVVFFHESSHALMTLVTGGQVLELVVNPMLGGHVVSVGGSRFLILSAGYIGSIICGVVIYLLAIVSKYDKATMVCLGAIVIVISALFVRDFFALSFGVAVGASMIAFGVKAPVQFNDFILRLIGLTSMLYVPLDIYSDTISRSSLRSDAFMLAEEYGGATILWGGVWLSISVVILVFTLRVSLKVKGIFGKGRG